MLRSCSLMLLALCLTGCANWPWSAAKTAAVDPFVDQATTGQPSVELEPVSQSDLSFAP